MERNISLDYFKCLLAFLVVLIHVPWSNITFMGWIVTSGISRIAVPCFFIINGYFLSEKINDSTFIKKYVLKLLRIYFVWIFIYAAFNFYTGTSSFKDLFFHMIVGYGHLWYVLILIEATIIIYWIQKKYPLSNFIPYLITALLIFVLIYSLQKKFYYIFLYRNFLLGVSFILLGIIIKNKKHLFLMVKDYILCTAIIFSIFVLIIESWFTYRLGVTYDLYISLIVLCPVLFILVLKKSQYSSNFNDFWGKMSSSMYYSHLLVIFYCAHFLPSISNVTAKLPFIYIAILMFSYAIIEMNKKFKILL